ncbi:hypothetical protein BV20DRAFT_979322 [Pilatotrama ljubarskyi]|nr:hypothetical protein BV20DRAFT_979322 [Pilatotrama ljubarskyi]
MCLKLQATCDAPTITSYNDKLRSLYEIAERCAHATPEDKRDDCGLSSLVTFVKNGPPSSSPVELKATFGQPTLEAMDTSDHLKLVLKLVHVKMESAQGDVSLEAENIYAAFKVPACSKTLDRGEHTQHRRFITANLLHLDKAELLSISDDSNAAYGILLAKYSSLVPYLTDYLRMLHDAQRFNFVESDRPLLPINQIDTLRNTILDVCDQLVAITQESINAYFSRYYKLVPILREWKNEPSGVEAAFDVPQVFLLAEEQAKVLVHINSWSFTPLGGQQNGSADVSEARSRVITDFYIQFVVDLVEQTHQELVGASSELIKASPAVVKYADNDDYALKHLVFDLQGARYVKDDGHIVEDELQQRISEHILKAYFPALCQEGLNVIGSIPIWTGPNPPAYATRAIDFLVHPGPNPTLVIYGVSNRDLPATDAILSLSWIPGLRALSNGLSYGTMAIAKRVFLESVVLKRLARINALTTLIPCIYAGIPIIPVNLNLKTLAEVQDRNDGRVPGCTAWKPDAESPACYIWEYRPEQAHKVVSSSIQFNGAETVTCATENRLSATTGQDCLRIQIDGETTLTLTSNETTASAHASIKWGLTFEVEVVMGALLVKQFERIPLVPAAPTGGVGAEGLSSELQQRLQGSFKLPDKDTIDQMMGIATAEPGAPASAGGASGPFLYPPGGAYNLGKAIFNNGGDLLVDLSRVESD